MLLASGIERTGTSESLPEACCKSVIAAEALKEADRRGEVGV